MPSKTSSQPHRPLPIWAILRDSFLIPWERRNYFGRLAIVPFLLSAFLSFVIDYWYFDLREAGKGGFAALSGIFFMIPHFLILTLLAVPCHRSILLEDHSVKGFGLRPWSGRDSRFTLRLVLVYFLVPMVLVSVILSLIMGISTYLPFLLGVFGGVLGKDTDWDLFFVVFFLGLGAIVAFPAFYFIGRWSLLLPATAVDLRPSMNQIWLLTEGNGWRLAVLAGIIPIALSFIVFLVFQEITGLTEGYLFDILGSGFYYVAAIVEVAILSLSFRYLSRFQIPSEPIGGVS